MEAGRLLVMNSSHINLSYLGLYILQMLETYVKNTHAATHNQYTMKVMEVFDMEKENEKSNFKDYGNRLVNVCAFIPPGLGLWPQRVCPQFCFRSISRKLMVDFLHNAQTLLMGCRCAFFYLLLAHPAFIY